MVKTTWGGKIFYTCGSYKRYGASVCSKHYIAHDVLTKVILDDLNQLIAGMENLHQLAQQGAAQRPRSGTDQPQKLEAALQRIQRRRQSAYEDYQDALISKEDFLRYRADYDAQEQALQAQLDKLRDSVQDEPLSLPWVKAGVGAAGGAGSPHSRRRHPGNPRLRGKPHGDRLSVSGGLPRSAGGVSA